MNLKSFLKNNLFGYSIPQEYVCLSGDKLEQPLRIFLTTKSSPSAYEVSDTHIFLGYKPLIIGLYFDFSQSQIFKEDLFCLSFTTGVFKLDENWRQFLTSSNSVGRIMLKKNKEIKVGSETLILATGEYGQHNFLNPFHQHINRLTESYKAWQAGNVFLNSNLYEQVRIAYSVPRQIAVVTLGNANYGNLFPTDLHGPSGADYYFSSLRLGGKACEQVQIQKKICISSVDVSQYRHVYALGKNHMQNLHTIRSSDIDSNSSHFSIPLPKGVLEYYELECLDYHDIGIHRIFRYAIKSKGKVNNEGSSLSHVHRYFIQWRLSRKNETNYLLR